jgi:cytochrome c553
VFEADAKQVDAPRADAAPASGQQASAQQADEAELAFFENRIRPVLVEHCYSCHSAVAVEAGELQAGLFVDTRSGLLRGGDSGAAVIPGDPDASPLIAALRYETYEMPPEGQLDPPTIADFERWVRRGAIDPRESAVTPSHEPEIDFERARQHWAYQPITMPIVDPVRDAPSEIDALIRSRWESIPVATADSAEPASADLAEPVPADLADQRVLVRRLYFDLVGLPPSPEQIKDFISDTRPDKYARLVDRLMMSPEFGQRWGRHWLDLVRFAESVTLRGLVQHEAWRYRDYVVDAFNHDLAYDRFLLEQVAGDLLPYDSIAQAQSQHVATTFLTLGNNNLEDQDKEKLRMDAVDEQLNVIGSALLAQTIGCARCHDHKFDPIPTSDYYALAGILRNTKTMKDANVSSWIDRPLPIATDLASRIASSNQQIERLKSEIAELESRIAPAGGPSSKSIDSDNLMGLVVDNTAAELVGHWQTSSFSPHFVNAEYLHDGASDRGKKSATFRFSVPASGIYQVRLSYSPGSNRSDVVNVSIQDFVDTYVTTIDQTVPPPIDNLYTSVGEYRFEPEATGVVTISNHAANGHVIVDSVQIISIKDAGSNRAVEKPVASDQKRADLAVELKERKQQLTRAQQNAPSQPMYMAAVDEPEIEEIAIHIRGNVHQYGATAPRGFLSVVETGKSYEMPDDQSGRLELGRWLTDPENPLTARVIANRVWQHLFGEAIVRSPNNFGTTGVAPTHPRLLDYLAMRLIQHDWSIKHLVREIVLTETYRASSDATAAMRQIDPENRLWLRQNRKRIDAECLIDAMLIAGNQLDRRVGGKTIPDNLSADYGFDPHGQRRAIYWPVLRNSIPDVIKVFDGADPSLVTGRRNTSTVATQALLMMNNDWIIQQSEVAGQQFLRAPFADDTRRAEMMFETILSRPPSAEELDAVLRFVSESSTGAAADERQQRWANVVQSLWSTIDFRVLY